jgi:hypothetical protein
LAKPRTLSTFEQLTAEEIAIGFELLEPLLEAHRLHVPGTKQEAATQEWVAKGGVAVTTFEALRALPPGLDVSAGWSGVVARSAPPPLHAPGSPRWRGPPDRQNVVKSLQYLIDDHL